MNNYTEEEKKQLKEREIKNGIKQIEKKFKVIIKKIKIKF